VRLWEAGSGRALLEKKAHAAPVLCLALLAKDGAGELLAATGDRDGVACVWRLHEGAAVATLRGHKGHLTACAWLPADVAREDVGGSGGFDEDRGGGGSGSAVVGATSAAASAGGADLVVTGAQDGHVRVWDLRSSACVANVAAHASDKGSGAICDIAVASVSPLGSDGGGGGGGGDSAAAGAATRAGPGSESLIVTSGADRRICVLDPRAGFRVRTVFAEHRDFIYCLHAAGSLCFSGGGDGTLLAHDLSAGRPLWAVGAGLAAVRCIGVAGDAHLVACGDDGKCMTYTF
jgi:WD40 repeat protein